MHMYMYMSAVWEEKATQTLSHGFFAETIGWSVYIPNNPVSPSVTDRSHFKAHGQRGGIFTLRHNYSFSARVCGINHKADELELS